MGIEPDRALGAPAQTVIAGWDVDDVLLYHLGLGAGGDPTDERELRYVLEPDVQVLPTFSVIPSARACELALAAPGLEFDPALMLHGEHELVVHRPLPAAAQATGTGRVAALHDKGKAAVAVIEVDLEHDGVPLTTNRWSLFLRGAGGFGGDPGPKAVVRDLPERPDETFEVSTLPQQALLYRLCADRNPLHADPAFAARAGFDRPILHGLCTWGMTCKAITDGLLDGDAAAVAGWSARFAGTVFPGETLLVRCWRTDEGIVATASVAERDSVVLAHGLLRAVAA